MIRGMWSNSNEVLVSAFVSRGNVVRSYVAMFDNKGRRGALPIQLPDGRVKWKYWVARCVVEVPDLSVQFESFGTDGFATKKEAVAHAKAMANVFA